MSDQSGQQWVSGFNEVGEAILGKTAQEVNEIKLSQGTEAVNACYNEALFQTFLMRARVKYEQVSDAQRLKVTILKADPMDWRNESLQILDAIQKYD